MSKVGSWDIIAANNNATPPDGWPEGQAPSTVNDCAREMMAQIRTLISDIQYIDLDNTPSFLSTTTFSLAAADTTNFEVGRRLKLFDATTLYGTIINVTGTFIRVKLDSGALTTSLSSVAVAAIKETNNSLPNVVYRNHNVVLNGTFDIWQRGASFGAVVNNEYTADRFQYEAVNTASVNISRSERSAAAANVPTLLQAGVHINNSLLVAVSAVDAAIAAGDYAAISYRVEGYDWRQIAHNKMSLSFWVKTNRTGTYCVAIRSSNTSASVVQNYTVTAASTWTPFFLTFVEAPTTPYSWNYSSSTGVVLSWTLACGAAFQSGAGSQWSAMNALGTSSQVNFLASAGNTFAITGIVFKEGLADVAPEVRPFAQEYSACQRYYEVGSTTMRWQATTAAEEVRRTINYAVTKRDTPTITLFAGGVETNVNVSTAVNATTTRFDHRVIGSLVGVVNVDGAFFIVDAEL